MQFRYFIFSVLERPQQQRLFPSSSEKTCWRLSGCDWAEMTDVFCVGGPAWLRRALHETGFIIQLGSLTRPLVKTSTLSANLFVLLTSFPLEHTQQLKLHH